MCGGFTLTIEESCDTGQHRDDEGDCVTGTCADLDLACAAVNKACDDSGDYPVCGDCLPGYVPFGDRCIIEAVGHGDSCEKPADCLGEGWLGVDVLCYAYAVDGYCYTPNSSTCEVNGEPCTDDPNSVCVIDQTSEYSFCGGACAVDEDCNPGWMCQENDFNSGVSACEPIMDCATRGCNDDDLVEKLICDDSNGPGWAAQCWHNACLADPSPCAAIDNSDGTCTPAGQGLNCGCDEGFTWNMWGLTCDAAA